MPATASSPLGLPLTAPLSLLRGALLVVLVALAAYANSLGNGFAYDDGMIVEQNPAVVEGGPLEALGESWWPVHVEGAGLYRPVTLAAFSAEWRMGGGEPFLFHLVNVVGHALVSLAVFLLLIYGAGAGAMAASLGAGIFAVHPVHVEAVANVVGQAEILVALFFLAGCLAYLWDPPEGWWGRPLRLLAVAAAYALAIGSKEMGATLPAALLLLEVLARDDRSLLEGMRRELPLYALLGVVFLGFAGARVLVLGTLMGEVRAPSLLGLDTGERLLTALTLWPEYLRLLVFPLDLSADYGPAVLLPVRGLAGDVVLGGLLVGALGALAWAVRKTAPAVALGIAWFGVTILPVSQLLFPAGVLLAERTLYLPSVGLALVVAGGMEALPSAVGAAEEQGAEPAPGALRARRAVLAGGVVVGLLLLTRTVTRNPVWFDTYSTMQTLAREHPESFRSARSTGLGLLAAGLREEAAEYFELAVELNPNHYGLLTEAAALRGELGGWQRAEELLERAVSIAPERDAAYRILARHALLQGRFGPAHHAATTGLVRSGSTAVLWSMLSESYVLRGDLGAALRSREMALTIAPDSAANWARMAELRRAAGDTAGGGAASRRARELEVSVRPAEIPEGAKPLP